MTEWVLTIVLAAGMEPMHFDGYASLDDCLRAMVPHYQHLSATTWGNVSVGESLTIEAKTVISVCDPVEVSAPPPAPLTCTDACQAAFSAGGLLPAETMTCRDRCAGVAP